VNSGSDGEERSLDFLLVKSFEELAGGLARVVVERGTPSLGGLTLGIVGRGGNLVTVAPPAVLFTVSLASKVLRVVDIQPDIWESNAAVLKPLPRRCGGRWGLTAQATSTQPALANQVRTVNGAAFTNNEKRQGEQRNKGWLELQLTVLQG